MASEKMKQLISRRDDLEAEIKALHEVLDSQKSIGMEGALIDTEGFPRADIDIYSVRHARQKIICLQNDHKALMDEIEEELYRIHAEARLASQGTTQQEPAHVQEVKEIIIREPIGTVMSVDEGSPAELAGLKVGDSVVQFGSLTAENFQGLQNIATVVQHSIDKALPVAVVRDSLGEIMLLLVPKRWKPDKGLLGCNIKPVTSSR
ncbi:26S proteasome non-ATPase regulatory subunit 9-like [Ruditapes philippinarum]|uniref:26S proteasome non-ATPase regulatory subunit 9-like n=1 Tax=Ruditapes philippinarum TaxID=129788 RepID=UPI00295B4EB4|nr:26S proteasome non-ATPase regulatory subunit 9-like [Ruditapes philippinarum]